MERLTLEALARLVDEAPTPAEQAVLDADPDAAQELEALRAQRDALRDLPSVLPAEAWNAVEAKLLSAGLIRAPEGRPSGSGVAEDATTNAAPVVAARGAPWRGWRQAAAALVLFAGGMAAGWTAAPVGPGPSVAGAEGTAARSAEDEPAAARSLEDARLAVQAAEKRWLDAHNDYWRLVGARQPQAVADDPAVRLAALEALVAVGRAAVAESPSDAFFNGFMVTTLAQRQRALQQIGRDGWY